MPKWLFLVAFAGCMILAGCGGGTSTPIPTGGGGTGGPAVLQSINLTPTTASIAQGTTQAFTAMGSYSDGTTKDLTASVQWSCLLPILATVSSSAPTQGVATALSPGSVLISAMSGTVSNTAQLTITGATATSLAVTPATATIGFEGQQQFTAIATFSDMTTQDVTNQATWGFPPPAITGTGLAIGNALGMFNIRPTFDNISPTTPAVLTVDLSSLVSVSILPSNPLIANHTQVQFSVMGTFNDGSTRDLTSLATNWSSDNDAVAANFGFTPSVFKGTAAGPATITVSVGTFNPSTTLTVTSASLQSIAVTPANASLATSTKLAYTATGTFSDGSTQDITDSVTWSIQDQTGVALVTGTGVVTGVVSGPITVNVNTPLNLGLVAGSTPATVTTGTLQSVALTPASTFIVPGSSLTYSASGTFTDTSGNTTTQDVSGLVTWSSSAANVVTVTAGVATGQSVGPSSITATLTKISGTSDLMVVSPQQVSLAITPATASVVVGASTQLKATGTFVDGTTQDFTTLVNWSTSNYNAATVGYQTGLVSGLAAEKSPITVTATIGSVTASAQITVTN